MGDVRQNGSLVRFGVFELDLCAGELRKRGVKIRLQEQPFQVLQVLLERPGEVVTREELQKRLWPNTFVDADHGLYNAVKKLREALGDESDTPRFIETVPKRGYRFIGTLNGNGRALPRSRLAIATVVAALLIGTLLVPRLLTKVERTSASSLPSPSKSNAQQHFLEGRYHADQAYEAVVFKSGSMKKSEDEFAEGVSLLEVSIREDPNYVPAYLALAKAIMGEPPHVDLLPKVRAALIKALSFAEANPECHLLMANYLWFEGEGGWDEPENHYKRAIQLRPDYAEGHEAYAEYLDDLGQFEAGMKSTRGRRRWTRVQII